MWFDAYLYLNYSNMGTTAYITSRLDCYALKWRLQTLHTSPFKYLCTIYRWSARNLQLHSFGNLKTNDFLIGHPSLVAEKAWISFVKSNVRNGRWEIFDIYVKNVWVRTLLVRDSYIITFLLTRYLIMSKKAVGFF